MEQQKRPRGRPKKPKPTEMPSPSDKMEMGPSQPEPPPSAADDQQSEQIHQVKASDLSATARKAEAYAKHTPDEPMHQTRCRECNGSMWTWGDKEDICETCGFEIRQKKIENAKLRNKSKKPRNSFSDGNERQIPVGIAGKKQRKIQAFGPSPEKTAKIPFGIGGHRGPMKNPFSEG